MADLEMGLRRLETHQLQPQVLELEGLQLQSLLEILIPAQFLMMVQWSVGGEMVILAH